jgi:hypothetical protein
MKKIILLIAITLLTGCTANYDIKILEDKITDNIQIYTDNKTVKIASQEQTEKFYQELGNWERGYEYYKRELYTTDKITGYKYTYDFSYNEYDAMSQIRKCYNDFEFTHNEDKIEIKTSEEFLCKNYYKNVNKISINITSEYEILNSNADIKTNDIHTWTITNTNYQNKPIKITLLKKKNIKEKEAQKLEIKNILIFIIFILLIIVLIIQKKDKKQK